MRGAYHLNALERLVLIVALSSHFGVVVILEVTCCKFESCVFNVVEAVGDAVFLVHEA